MYNLTRTLMIQRFINKIYAYVKCLNTRNTNIKVQTAFSYKQKYFCNLDSLSQCLKSKQIEERTQSSCRNQYIERSRLTISLFFIHVDVVKNDTKRLTVLKIFIEILFNQPLTKYPGHFSNIRRYSKSIISTYTTN